MRFYIEIIEKGNYYKGIQQNNPIITLPLSNLKIGQDDKISIKGQYYKLGDLIKMFIEFNHNDLQTFFDEHCQFRIGQYLYSQIFGKLSQKEQKQLYDADEVEVHIITKDEHISRLPWVLLANKSAFLSTRKWSVSISSNIKTIDCELPPSPRMLVIAPQPYDLEKTDATDHLKKLEERLAKDDPLLTWDKNLRVAKTWEDFTKMVKEFEPQIIYYYGHGKGDIHKTHLIFATGRHNKCYEVPVPDFALCLKSLNIAPRLVYVNCCHGDAGGFLGIGMQLEDFIPAVITNRTLTYIEAAQSMALALWDSILLKGMTPHQAVTTLYGRMIDLKLTTADVRWMTPVLHRHYDNWCANPPRHIMYIDRNWKLKINRVSQFGSVIYKTQQMLSEGQPRSLAFTWYGRKGEGISIFHQRLSKELGENLKKNFNCDIYEVRPAWPSVLYDYHRSYKDMLLNVFNVGHLDLIPARIRSETYAITGRQTLVYVRHHPVTSNKLINPESLKDYLEWWDEIFVPLLDKHQFALMGVSFVEKNPLEFQNKIKKEHLEDLDLNNTVFWLLDEMEKLARKDLLEFFQKHNIPLTSKNRELVLNRILERTKGHYDLTIEELENIPEYISGPTAKDNQTGKKSKKKYNY